MKLNTFILSVLTSFSIIGCNSNTKTISDEKNSITANQDSIQLLYRYDQEKIDTIFTKKNEAVSFTFGEDFQNGMLFHPQTNTRIPLYLGNKKTNSVVIDSSKNGKLGFHYAGDNTKINEYILKSFPAQQVLMKAMRGDYPSFKVAVDKATSERIKELELVTDPDFLKTEKTTLDYLPKNLKLAYAFEQAMRNKVNLDSINPEITQLVNESPIEDISLLNSEGFKNYLTMKSQIEFYKIHPEKMNSIFDQLMNLKEYFKTPEYIGTVGESVLNFYFLYENDTENDTEVKAFINKYITDSNKKERFLAKFNKRGEFSKGTIAPSFSGFDINGKEVTSESLKGKFLVVDVWATWCAPCKKEAPYFSKLAEKYKNDDRIEFISISIDQSKEAWKKHLTKENPAWLNLWVENDFESNLTKDFKISGIPYFMIIDPEGNFAVTDTSRPSDKMDSQISALLK